MLTNMRKPDSHWMRDAGMVAYVYDGYVVLRGNVEFTSCVLSILCVIYANYITSILIITTAI